MTDNTNIQDEREKTTSLKGKVLVAMPDMGDPRFERAVIFMVEHDEKGAMGIVVNKPFDAIIFGDLLEQLKIEPLCDLGDKRVLFGGPVDIGRGFVLHSDDVVMAHSERIAEDMALTTSMDMLRRVAENTGPKKSLFILGYSGWTAGQLEGELKQNVWLICDVTSDLLFEVPIEMRWEYAIRALGIDLDKLSSSYGNA